jgi:hypothetical protein
MHLTTWWCIAHRTNLCLGDVLKDKKEFVKFLRLLVSFTHSSSHAGRVDEQSALFAKLAGDLDKVGNSLDLKIAGVDPHDPEHDAEVKRLGAEKDANRLSQKEFEQALKALGRKHKLKDYLTVRWLSLFDTIDSIMAQFLILTEVLEKQAQPFQQRLNSHSADLAESLENVNIFLAPALSAAERATRAEEDDEAGSEADESAPAEGKARRKFYTGEKAYHLCRKLQEHKLFMCFLHEFGKHYRSLVKFYQHTSEPIGHLLYYEILRIQQLLFNLCLQFKEAAVAPQAAACGCGAGRSREAEAESPESPWRRRQYSVLYVSFQV